MIRFLRNVTWAVLLVPLTIAYKIAHHTADVLGLATIAVGKKIQ